MQQQRAVTVNTATSPGSLARLVASRLVEPAKMSGPQAAATLMLAQFPLQRSGVTKGPSTKLNSAERRRRKIESGKLFVDDGKLHGF